MADLGVEVLGITPCAVGVAAATERAHRAGLRGATFEVRDGKITLWDDAFSWVDFARGSLVGLTKMLG